MASCSDLDASIDDTRMSSGLMSCVRENSPPLELELDASGDGPLSLPEGNIGRSHGRHGPCPATSTPISSPGNDGHEPANVAEQHQQQQKRRRFHPLRNLRRIFRRRTINSSADSPIACQSPTAAPGPGPGPGSCNTLPPPASSSSEKNLRSVTAAAASVIGSSPGSPLNHQSLGESYQTQSLPKSKSYGSHRDELLSVLLGKKRASKQAQHSSDLQQQQQQQQQQFPTDAMYQTQRQQLGVAVFPETRSLSRSSYFSEQRHLRSVGDSSQELGMEREGNSNSNTSTGSAGGTADISDSQRSLSAARLLDVDGDYSRETLSQSHDSVFSESATASSLSIVLKAELTDVLRKRRNRPDASDEDLGLPRSPASPQRRVAGGQSRSGAAGHSQARGHSQSEVSSLSIHSVNSAEETENSQSHSHSQSQSHRYHSRVSTSSSVSMGSDILRPHHEDEVDAVGTERHRLSHAAAKHKMAIRPAKKKGPSRQHRRTLESSIPEANEDLQKTCPGLRAVRDADLKSRTRSLPPKTVPAIATSPSSTTPVASNANASSAASSITTKRTKTIELATRTTSQVTTTSATTSQIFGPRAPTTSSTTASSTTAKATKAKTVLESRGESSTDGDDALAASESSESGLLRRLIHRNSKRSIARANDGLEDTDSSQSVAKKLQISNSSLDAAFREPLQILDKSRIATSHQQHVQQETRQMIKREIHNEASHSHSHGHGHGRTAIVSHLGVGVTAQPQMASKPKSGPAARQRYIPQELGSSSPAVTLNSSPSNDVTNLLSKSTRGNDTFQSTTLVREQQVRAETTDRAHFERKPRIVGLSAFQQKLSRSSDSMGHNSSSSNSLETSTDEPSPLYYEEKQRKTVEKSRSFRNYQEERESVVESTVVHNHMPSLPDLSISFRLPSYYKQHSPRSPPQSPRSPLSPNTKCVSLGFEINDNKLLQGRTECTGQFPALTKSSPQRSNKLLVQSSPGPANISQIEQNIDMIVKSPLVSVLRKSATVSEQLTVEQATPAAKLQPERPKLLDLGKKPITSTAMAICSPSPASPLSKSAKLSHSPPATPAKSSNNNNNNSNNNSCESSRRNSSNVETAVEPEFMKIQLNRVDQASLHKKTNHLVLAKNLKSPTERSQSSDDLSSRRSSGASVEVVQQTGMQTDRSPSAVPPNRRQALEPNLGRQLRSVSANSVRTSFGSSSGSTEGLSSANTPATTPSTPKSNGIPIPIARLETAPPREQKENKLNRLSLEERKRLFLNEERTERHAVEQRKQSIGKAELPPAVSAPAPAAAPATPPRTPELAEVNGNANPVVLRKKSFASCNGSPSPNKDDPTPELMKVFARRSLKVKDDEVVAPAQPVSKKISAPSGSQSVDSDKENQSNSEEKLDKLSPKYEAQVSGEFTKTASQHASSNRNSVADFRNLNSSNNSNNSNNNNNSHISSNLQKAANGQQKVVTYLPPIKVSNGVRNSLTNNNNSNNNGGAKPANERMSLQMKQAATPSAAPPPAAQAQATHTIAASVAGSVSPATGAMTMSGKPIERSATVGEFKGIHQRRAEWEQRAKEALK